MTKSRAEAHIGCGRKADVVLVVVVVLVVSACVGRGAGGMRGYRI